MQQLISQLEVPVKKFLALFTGVLAVCGLSANPMGNPADPVIYEDGISMTGKSDMSYRLGYIGDFVMDRKLRIKHQKDTKTETAEKDFNGAELTVNMYDRFDVFGRLGYSSYNTRWLSPLFGTGTALRTSTRSDFAWALGAKGVLYQWDNTTVTVNGSYAQGNAKVDRVELTGTSIISGLSSGLTHVTDLGVKQRERKWNLGASVGYQIENFSPYVGLQYIKDKCSFNHDGSIAQLKNLARLENRKKIGGVLGLGMTSGKKASLNIEGRFLGEIALALTGQARF